MSLSTSPTISFSWQRLHHRVIILLLVHELSEKTVRTNAVDGEYTEFQDFVEQRLHETESI